MSDLVQNPVWQAEQLGQPMPASVHGVSVALPRWQDVVGYEEKKPETMARLSSGYPRFLIHPLVLELGRHLGNGQPCLPFPSLRVAERCAAFVCQTTGAEARVASRDDIHGVVANERGQAALRSFWQHTGWIVSSRQAEAHLAGRRSLPDDQAIRHSLRRQLAEFYECPETDVFLTPTGMAAVHAALQAVNARTPNRPAVQLGFPYVDTLKLQQKFGPGGVLLHDLETIETDLEQLDRKSV